MSGRTLGTRLLVVSVAAVWLGACGRSSAAGDADVAGDAVADEARGDVVADTGADLPDVREDVAADDVIIPDVVEPADEAGDDGADVEDVAPRLVSCADTPPSGSVLPDPLPTYAGTCPALVTGRNTIVSSGNAREFLLAVPTDIDPSESLPVIFLWHWLGGDAQGFMDKGDVQNAANAQRFIALAPESKGDLPLQWPYSLASLPARVDEELRFFDDMLACVAAQYNVNASCVSSVGVSAGALWTSQLAPRRSRTIANFVSLSGGVGASGDLLNPILPWPGAEHAQPAIVLWGGPTDFCGVTFSQTSHHLEDALGAQDSFFIECIHNCAHAEPPFTPPAGETKYAFMWGFVLSHPYWLRPGESPYLVTGLPADTPEWCGIGPGSATLRTGDCPDGPLGSCL